MKLIGEKNLFEDKVVWALGINLGASGRLSPITLIEDEKEAMSVRRMLERTHGTEVYCVQVPFWPSLRLIPNNGNGA